MPSTKQNILTVRVEDTSFQLLTMVNHSQYVSNDEENLLTKTLKYSYHMHSFVEMFICERGSITVKTKKGDVVLFPDDIAIIPSGLEHVKIPTPAEVVWKSVCFSISRLRTYSSEKYYNRFQSILGGTEPFVVRNDLDFSQKLLNIINRLENTDLSFIALEFAALLSHLVSPCHSTRQTVKSSNTASYSIDIDRLAYLEQIIATEFAKDYDIQKVANQFYISPHQLNRICRKRYGVTFRQAIVNRRLVIAIQMFENSKMTIEEIGNIVGFHSRTSFFRAFSSQYGISPSEYRKSYCSGKNMLQDKA